MSKITATEIEASRKPLPPILSMRDWFAGMAMSGIQANSEFADMSDNAIADSAYDLADAMMKERTKTDDN